MSEVLSDEWRRSHVEKGDAALLRAYDELGHMEGYFSQCTERAKLFAVLAQAHYQAANVRARPAPAYADIHKAP